MRQNRTKMPQNLTRIDTVRKRFSAFAWEKMGEHSAKT
jgi:hypothetical protein